MNRQEWKSIESATKVLELHGYTKDARRLEEILDADAARSDRYRQAYAYAQERNALRGKSLEDFALAYARRRLDGLWQHVGPQGVLDEIEASYIAYLERGPY